MKRLYGVEAEIVEHEKQSENIDEGQQRRQA
jgi:hypothetical protein